MKIKKCKIDGFGGITNREFPLDAGFQKICRKNGWGKSTLAVFLKVMFYGFSDEGKMIAQREREKFRPWQDVNVYGGSIEFEYKGKTYELRRTFGKKIAEDTLHVTDLATNLEAEAFKNVEVPGVELYGLDAESFYKTIYIADGACASGATDSINARIGNPGSGDADAAKLGDVLKKLKDEANALTSKRITGKGAKIDAQITGLRGTLNGRPAIEERLKKQQQEREQRREEIARMQEELKKKRSFYASEGVRNERRAERRHYQNLVSRVRTAEELLKEEEGFFGGCLPENDKLRAAEERLTEIEKKSTRQEDHALTPEEEKELSRLKERYPEEITETVLDRADEYARRIKEILQEKTELQLSREEEERYTELKTRYGKEESVSDLVSMGELRSCSERISASIAAEELHCDQIRAKESNRADREAVLLRSWEQEQERADRQSAAALDRLERRADERNYRREKSGKLMLLLAVLFLLGGAGLAYFGRASVPMLASGGALAVVAVICLVMRAAGISAEKKAVAEDEAERERIRQDSEIPAPEDFEDGVYRPEEKQKNRDELKEAERNLRDLKEQRDAAGANLKKLLEAYGCSAREGAEAAEIERLELEQKEYRKLQAKAMQYEKSACDERIEEARKEIKELLPIQECAPGEEVQVLLRTRQELKTLADLTARAQTAKHSAEAFAELKKENDELLDSYRKLHPDITGDADLVNALQVHLTKYHTHTEAVDAAKKALKEYEESHDPELYRSAEGAADEEGQASDPDNILEAGQNTAETDVDAEATDMSALKQELEDLESKIEKFKDELQTITEQTTESEAELDHLDELQEELDELLKERKICTKRQDIYKKTGDYLSRAKEEYLSSFVKPLEDAFAEHYAAISDTADRYRIDVDLNLSCEKVGDFRTVERQSSGYKDLAYFCLRLALVDIMYEKEIPFLIMDDPFVHLDEEKRKRALAYLEKKSNRYQILYLTCREENEEAGEESK